MKNTKENLKAICRTEVMLRIWLKERDLSIIMLCCSMVNPYLGVIFSIVQIEN